jgi:GxxExxY protein
MSSPNYQELLHGDLTRAIIGAFFEVFRILGYGSSEHVYAAVLEKELTRRGFRVQREVSVPVYYRGEIAAWQRLDMLVNDLIVIEIKIGEKLPQIASSQLYNYLRCTNLELGLLLHFGHQPKFQRIVHSRAFKSIGHA